jgi:hypothetical protein
MTGGQATGGLAPFESCDGYVVEQLGSAGAPAPVTEETRCECDRWGQSCYVEPESYCYGPPELGCDPMLDEARRSPGLLCSEWFRYQECDDTVRIDVAGSALDRMQYVFDRETGILVHAEAYPVLADCGSLPGRVASVSADRDGSPGNDRGCRSCELSQSDEAETCVMVDGHIALPEAGPGGAAGAPAIPEIDPSAAAGSGGSAT